MPTFITKPCAYCGTEFSRTPAQGAAHRRYCSFACSVKARSKLAQARRTTAVCQQCGETFSVRHIGNKNIYCSKICKDAAVRGIKKVFHEPRTCPVCGQQFEIKNWTPAVYCSKMCSRLGIRKEQREDITNCQICGVNLTKRQIVCRNKYCSRTCLTEAVRRWHSDPENKEFMRQHGAKCAAQGQRAPTSIEIAMAKQLTATGIDFIYQYPVGNLYGTVFVCDFAVRGTMIVIECDGTYWHSLPNIKKRDKQKDKYLRAAGYTVLRFSEAQINQDAEQCARTVLEYL